MLRTMPASLHLHLHLDHPVNNPLTSARGIVLERLAEHNPTLERTLHNQPQTRYAINVLEDSHEDLALRVNVIQEDLIEDFQMALTEGASFGLETGTPGRITRARTTGETYQHLIERHATNVVPRLLHWRFNTCTSLTRENQPVTTPDPVAILGGLAKRWRDNAPDLEQTALHLPSAAFVNEMREYARDHTRVLTQDTQPSQVRISHGAVIDGFTGTMLLELRGTPVQARRAALLASFAVFAGVGVSVAFGLGETRLEHVDYAWVG